MPCSRTLYLNIQLSECVDDDSIQPSIFIFQILERARSRQKLQCIWFQLVYSVHYTPIMRWPYAACITMYTYIFRLQRAPFESVLSSSRDPQKDCVQLHIQCSRDSLDLKSSSRVQKCFYQSFCLQHFFRESCYDIHCIVQELVRNTHDARLQAFI